MSLFDVIRYGHTDLDSVNSLLLLPKGVLEKYFQIITNSDTPFTLEADRFPVAQAAVFRYNEMYSSVYRKILLNILEEYQN